jgi:hypothetical protein
MFFPAFSEEVASRLTREAIFTVEYLTSQILVNAEPSFLGEAISRGNFIEALLQELEVFGQLRKDDLPDVRAYLASQQSSLQETAKIILKERDNPTSRQYWLSPHPVQTS